MTSRSRPSAGLKRAARDCVLGSRSFRTTGKAKGLPVPVRRSGMRGTMWRGFVFVQMGQPLTSGERKRSNRAIRRRLASRAGPGTIAEILVRTARDVATRNSAVGNNLLVTSLVRDRLPAPLELRLPGAHPPIDWTENVFRYLASDLDDSTVTRPAGHARALPWPTQRSRGTQSQQGRVSG